MPDPRLKFQSWSRSVLMLSRWRRRAHHPHRRVFGGRMRNGRRTCRLAWRPWRLAPGVRN
eukprot:628768-Pleurochrysis_carterae.AAC.1